MTASIARSMWWGRGAPLVAIGKIQNFLVRAKFLRARANIFLVAKSVSNSIKLEC